MDTTLSIFLFTTLIIIITSKVSQGQTQAPPPAADACNGIFLTYTYTDGARISPILRTDPARQPYRFQSTLTVLNNGLQDLRSWRVFVGFQHNEYLVSASNAVLANGTSLPASVGNGTVVAGYPTTDLQTAVETAGDMTQMSVQIQFVGTQFGVGLPNVPMPSNISLANDGFICPRPTMQGTRVMQVCCNRDLNFVSNGTSEEEFMPRQNGDLTIMYDVIRTYASSYWAQVTISNRNPLGRLDNWRLSWDWMREEFIFAMRGAYPNVVDSSDCIFGNQGQYYRELDFSTVLNCERRPTIIDLPLTRANDTNIGMLPFCCRNGTILPSTMDPSRSTSAFQINVYKMPPDLNRSQLTPPQNWNINGDTLNPDYQCGPPVRVSPSEFPDPSGLPSSSVAVASWQVVCNITQRASPRCCVSFSAYYNESVIPCPTCACGCPSTTSRTCSTNSRALLLPSQALLVPFDNRTNMAIAWADLNHLPLPNALPCGDNCGVSINWHLFTDYRGGWTARMTISNWEDVAFADWFVGVELDRAIPGFEQAYSFNGTVLNNVNNTIFMQGRPGLNYIMEETDGVDPQRDPRVSGKQQSVISFTKRDTPGIDIPGGDGFPTRVYFNGEECSLPNLLPTSNSYRLSSAVATCVIAIVVLTMMMMMQQ